MKKIIFTYFLAISFIACKNNKAIAEDEIRNKSDLEGLIIDNEEHFVVRVLNNSSTEKFLLTSYIDNRFTYNDNLYDVKDDEVRISFLPLLKYLGTIKSDVLIVDNTSVLKPKQTVYSFKKIAPKSEIEFKLLKSKLLTLGYENAYKVSIKLAIYSNVDLLTVQGIEYNNESKKPFIEQSKKYKTLTINSK